MYRYCNGRKDYSGGKLGKSLGYDDRELRAGLRHAGTWQHALHRQGKRMVSSQSRLENIGRRYRIITANSLGTLNSPFRHSCHLCTVGGDCVMLNRHQRCLWRVRWRGGRGSLVVG